MTFMERTCFRFVPLPRNSFVFIIEIGYILFYLRLRGDKCLRCAPFRRYLLSSTATSSMRHLLSAFLGTRKILLSRAHSKCSVSRARASSSSFVGEHFHVLFTLARMLQLSQSVGDLPVALPTASVMNENVFYVTLHNIIVFNKQILLSLHLIAQRTSRIWATSLRKMFT